MFEARKKQVQMIPNHTPDNALQSLLNQHPECKELELQVNVVIMAGGTTPLKAELLILDAQPALQVGFNKHFPNPRILQQHLQQQSRAFGFQYIVRPDPLQYSEIPAQGQPNLRAVLGLPRQGCTAVVFKGKIPNRGPRCARKIA